MLTLFVFVPLILAAIVVSTIVRMVLLPFRHRRTYGGFGYRRRRHPGGMLLSILALVALDRLFTARRF